MNELGARRRLAMYLVSTRRTQVNQQLKAYLISLARLFVTACLAVYFTINESVFDLDFADGKAILSAGIAAVLMSIFNALNPKDERYGVGAPRSKELSAGDVATNTTDGGHSVVEVVLIAALVAIVVVVLARLI